MLVFFGSTITTSVFISVSIIVLLHNLILLFHVFFPPCSLAARLTRTVVVTFLVVLALVLTIGWLRVTDIDVNAREAMALLICLPIPFIVVSFFVWAIAYTFGASKQNAKLSAYFVVSLAPLVAGVMPSFEKDRQVMRTEQDLEQRHYSDFFDYQRDVEYVSRVKNSKRQFLLYGAGTTLAYVAIGFVALGIVRRFPKKEGAERAGPKREVGKTHGDR